MIPEREDALIGRLLSEAENPEAPPFALRRLDPEAAQQAAPEFAPLVELWLRRRGPERVPDWSQVEFSDFRGWHSALLFSGFDGPQPDPLFRIMGEDFRVATTIGSIVGKRMSELLPRLYESQLKAHFQEIRQHGLIGLAVGPAPVVGRKHVRLRILELPFRHGGADVRRLLHAFRTDF